MATTREDIEARFKKGQTTEVAWREVLGRSLAFADDLGSYVLLPGGCLNPKMRGGACFLTAVHASKCLNDADPKKMCHTCAAAWHATMVVRALKKVAAPDPVRAPALTTHAKAPITIADLRAIGVGGRVTLTDGRNGQLVKINRTTIDVWIDGTHKPKGDRMYPTMLAEARFK